MAEKEFKQISPRAENIIKGLFLVLFSIVIGINAGKVGRTLTFLPLYLFGISYYLIAIFLLFLGTYRIIRKKKFKIERLFTKVGLVIFLFATTFIFSYALTKAGGRSYNNINIVDLLNKYNGQLGSYYTAKYINLFDTNSYWGGGLIGQLLSSLVSNDIIVLFLGITLFVISMLCIFARALINLFKKEHKDNKAKKESRKEAIKKYREENRPVEKEIPEINRDLEPQKMEVGFENDKTPFVNENSGFDRVNMSLDDAYGKKVINNRVDNGYSEFKPLSFSNEPKPFQARPQIVPPQPQVVAAPIQEQKPIHEEVINHDEIEEEINLIDSRPIVEEPVQEETPVVEEEQKPVIDDSLVMFQPQFSDIPEMKSEPVSAPIKEPQPVEEAPKKRERVVWIPPRSDILMEYQTEEQQELNINVANERVNALNQILSDYRTGANISGYTIGPSITRFNVSYESNVSSKTVEKYVQDISRRLGGVSTRFASVVPGESYSGLEVPNAAVTTVGFKEVFNELPDVKKHPLAVAFGKDISGNVVYADFDEFPHLLVAGTTGSGKSIYVHSIISTLIMRVSPDDLKIVLVDPKKVEMTKYRDMPHLLCPIITEAEKAKVCLDKLCEEMNRRYDVFAENGEVSNIKDYNKYAKEVGIDPMPFILVFIDEYADLVDSCKEISQPVVSIAQKARAAGIHMCIATQRPSTNIITGVIKGNIPTHVALMTSSYTDSIIIIGEAGAETLLGKGDMLVQSPLVSRVGVTRLQGCFIQNKEIVHIVNYLKEHYETIYDPNYLDLVDHSKEPATNVLAPGETLKESSDEEENKYQSIKSWVMTQEFVSMSKIQRECSVGFNRAGRFFSRLQAEGIVAKTQDGSSKGCKVLVHDDYDAVSVGAVVSNELVTRYGDDN